MKLLVDSMLTGNERKIMSLKGVSENNVLHENCTCDSDSAGFVAISTELQSYYSSVKTCDDDFFYKWPRRKA